MTNLWSKDKVELLKKLYPTASIQEIMDKTGRSRAAIRHKAFCMGIKRDKVYTDWPPNEIKLLKKLFPTTRNREMAERLGRSMKAVRMKAFFLDLEKKSH